MLLDNSIGCRIVERCTDMGLLDGRNTIITGSARGLGLAMAERFGEEGARVVLSDIDANALDEARSKLAARGFEITALAADVTDEESMAALVGHCADTWGAVDVMVNNAGITRDNVLRKMSTADFMQVIQVHMLGAWLGTKMASLRMREQGSGGSIINISSMSGKVGNPGQTNYSAAKAGLIGLTKAAAKEGARYGIRVNAIQPGFIRTAMTDAMPQDVLNARVAEIPLGRMGEPRDVANTALFLASDLASYLTGITIEVSGGRNM
jgi:3-oxoacyl-[acyl-carrier protein] reductase